MGIEKKEVEYTKETDDVMRLLVEVVRDLKDKKGLSGTLTENLQNAIDAASGANEIGGEFKEHRKVALQTVGYRSGELTDAIMGPQAPEALSEPAA